MRFSIIILGILIGCFFTQCNETTVVLPELGETEVIELPVVFHVLHNGETVGTGSNLDAAMLEEQLQLLNAAFRNTNGNSIDIQIEFRLATTNPDGDTLAEAGIHRMERTETNQPGDGDFFSQDWVLDELWDMNQYINIWVAQVEDEFSWTTQPYASEDNSLEGLVVLENKFLNQDPSFPQGILLHVDHIENGDADILTHEMGHYLGLYHVFNESDCTSDDYCEDTHHYNRSTYDPVQDQTNRTSCENVDFDANNFMDYYITLTLLFSEQQRTRMRHVMAYSPYRAQLRISDKNLIKPTKGETPPQPTIQACKPFQH